MTRLTVHRNVRPLGKRKVTIAAIIATAVVLTLASAAIIGTYAGNTADSTRTPEGSIPAELAGRHFAARETSADGRTHTFGANTITVTFHLGGWVEIFGCGGDDWRPVGGTRDWIGPLVFTLADCDPIEAGYLWSSAYNDGGQPTWEVRDDTLIVKAGSTTARFVDAREGRDPATLLGDRFVGDRWSLDPEGDDPRLRPDIQLTLSFDDDGTIHASLGCESGTMPAVVEAGRIRRAGSLDVDVTSDCSPAMATQETGWLWDFLDQPLRWQFDGNLALRSDATMLYLSPVSGASGRSDPAFLAGTTWSVASIDNSRGARRAGLRDTGEASVTIDENGGFRANAGCERASVRGSVRAGWFRFRDRATTDRTECPRPDAEGWMSNFFARQPTWSVNREDSVVLRSGAAIMRLTR